MKILAVANRDMVIAWRNVADISRYLDAHAAHLAACTGALDDRQYSADGSGDLSPVARWHPVGPARHAEGLTNG